jgi:hypothetical protein
MALYFPGWEDLPALLITWAIGLLLLLIGSAVAGNRAAPEFRIGAGWGVLCLVLTAWGILLPWSLRIPAAAVALAAVTAQLIPSRRPTRDDWVALGRLLAVTLPLWAVMAPVRPSQVDTFLNLLPNANYLVDYGRFPTAALPPSYSMYPAAPYDTQFLAFLGSFADRDYPASGMSLIGVMLQLFAGLAVARVLARPAGAPSWAMTAAGMLLVTLLNSGFVPRFHFSAYGETGLAVTALFAACLFADPPPTRRRAPLQLALILAAMIETKQSAIGLVLALAGAGIAIGWLERARRPAAVLGRAIVLLLPAALLYGLWRYFVAGAGVDELKPLPFDQWNWALLPATLAAVAEAIIRKPTYFLAVAATVPCFVLLLRRQGWTQATRFLGFFVAAFVLYNLFILVTYIAHFSPEMSAEAHSYFRYNTHLSLVLMLALALAARELWPRLWARLRERRAPAATAIAVALIAPVALAERLRFDIEMPQPLVWDLAAAMKPYLHDRDRLALLLPGDDGDIGQLLSDYLANVPPRRLGLDIDRRSDADPATLDAVAAAGYQFALISCNPAGEAALMRHEPSGWRQIAAWPYSAGIPLSHWQRTRHWPAICR